MSSPHTTGPAPGEMAETQAEVGESEAPDRPSGPFDYGVIGVSTALVALTFYLAIKYLVTPGERHPSHIKRTILEEEP